MTMEVWGHEESAPSDVTLSALNDLIEKLRKMRDEKDQLASQVTQMEEGIKAVEMKLIDYLKDAGMTSFKGASGQVIINKRKNISQPSTPEDKQALFDYLKSQGIFEQMVSVNARTLSSWAVKEIEAKKDEGVYGWTPPGLKEPTEYDYISLRKA